MDKIIRSWHDGLGDSLQHSTLPSLFHQQGYDVYISAETPCSDEVYELVWGLSPFVKGKMDKPGNCGEIIGREPKNVCGSFIGNWEIANFLPYTNDYPIIYYQPVLCPELSDITLVDMSCKTSKREGDYDENVLQEYLDKQGGGGLVQIVGEKICSDRIYVNDTITVNNIYELCNYISSCKRYICLNSGGHSLASALKRNKHINVDCLVTDNARFRSMYERKNFFYPNINYVWLYDTNKQR